MTAVELGDRGPAPGSRRLPLVSGSEAALTELRTDIARLQDELDEIEQRIVDVRGGSADRSLSDARTPSARLADELSTRILERERADMARYLQGVAAVCEARVEEAQHEARMRLAGAGDELARAVRQRERLVEDALTSPLPPIVAHVPVDESVAEPPDRGDVPAASPSGIGGSEQTEHHAAPAVDLEAPIDGAARSRSRRQAVISLLLWIVGGALVVVGLAFAVVVILMFLD